MHTYEVVVGFHQEGTTEYGRGDTFVSAAPNLHEVFRNKLVLVEPASSVPPPAKTPEKTPPLAATVSPPPPASSDPPNRTGTGSPTSTPLGVDVTGDFKGADDAGVIVYQKGKRFNVADAEDPLTLMSANATKKAVGELIAELLE